MGIFKFGDLVWPLMEDAGSILLSPNPGKAFQKISRTLKYIFLLKRLCKTHSGRQREREDGIHATS